MKFGQIENHVIVDDKDTYRKNYIGNGTRGTCYRFEKDKVFKEIPQSIINPYLLKQFTFIEDKHSSFPRTIVYYKERKDENMQGYITDYMHGIMIKDIDENENMENIINACRNLEDRAAYLSKYEGIVLDDINPDCLRYTDDKIFNLLDVDSCLFEPSEEAYNNYKRSLMEIGNLMLLLYKTGFPFKDENLNNDFMKCIYNGKIRPSDFLIKILIKLRNELKKDDYTIKEFKESQKILKRY